MSFCKNYTRRSPARLLRRFSCWKALLCIVLANNSFDLTEVRVPKIIVRTSILWRSDRPGKHLGYTDGAKIYICYRRCCFLTGKRRSRLLDWLSPRKSRFQSHPSKMRSVPERGSRDDEFVSARRSVCDRRRRGDGPRPGTLRALHAREAFPRQ